ncbi:MAG: translocation/assembly module TamB domain-containing protein, partial [Saprospiraceae bacterium]
KKPTIVADVRIPEFTLNGIDYGSLSVRLDDDGDKAYASLNLNRVEDDLRLLFNAEYNKETKAINGEVTARNMVMETFEFIIDDGISETKGIANIKANVGGTADDIKLDGTAYVIGGQTRIDYIGTLLDLGTETFTISEDFIDLTGVRMYDKLGNQATMTGGLRHDLFGDFRTDLNMSSDRFLALDTDNTGNKLYYGTGIGEISVDFSGPFSSTDIVISAVTGKGTVLNIPIEDSYYDVDESFIKFVPREEIKKEKDSPGFVNSMKLEGVDVDMNLTMTTDAQVNLIFDERLNDVIKGVGNGDLRITIARDGNFNIFGDYVVDRGEYLFTAWGIVAKPFKVRSGGQITWTGDPVNANLNLQADYDDLRAPVNVLLAEYLVSGSANLEQQARKRTRVDLTLKLGGTLYNPIVNFDLSFPELQGELRTYADSKMITLRENEADLNEQVAGLIMFRSFLPSSSLGNVFTSSTSFVETTYNTLSEFVSNQLSYLLSGFLQEALTENGFISGIDFEIGFSKNANLLQGAPQSDNYLPDEIEVHFKPRFQNDRWGFDYGTSFVNPNEQATTAITNYVIHDFVLEYYLTADRRLKLRAYGRWDKDEVQFQNEQKYGLGINYRKEFGSLTKFKDALTSDISQLRPEGQ